MDIDWDLLESCAGLANAGDIPESIEHLFSSDAKLREKGYWGIDNHAVVQSDLYSSAPYAARLIVDRFLQGKVVTYELVNIFFELFNGSGPEVLKVGLLQGETIESLCRKIIREVKLELTQQLDGLEPDLAIEVESLIELFNE